MRRRVATARLGSSVIRQPSASWQLELCSAQYPVGRTSVSARAEEWATGFSNRQWVSRRQSFASGPQRSARLGFSISSAKALEAPLKLTVQVSLEISILWLPQ